jgi:UDP-GlcNAc:undecaprenyl-phosphate GlcNAc-1-phosphate transferase
MILLVLGLIAVGFAISLPLTATLVRLGHRIGAMDSDGVEGHEKSLRSVPNIGGLAIYAAVAAPLAAGIAALWLIDAETWERWIPGMAGHLERILEGGTAIGPSATTAIALLVAMTALHVLGLVDDRIGLGPVIKLVVQIGAAAVLAIWFDVRLLELLGPVPSVIITVVWIVTITNAINFLDNMDGLAAGVAAVAGTLFMIATIVNAQWFIAGTLALLVGGLAGFLVFNFPPARIFMGDGGSLVVGFLLGVLTARTTFVHDDPSYALGTAWYGVLMPPVVLAIPLYDLVTVTWLRLKQGRSPLVGDQQHFSHRLVQRGMSPRGAVVVIWAATLVTGIGGVALGRLAAWQAVLVGVQTAAVLLMLALSEHASRHAVDK